ncbi:MAG: hypothetical protein AB7I19_11415 [Planctomycetota bacterium]
MPTYDDDSELDRYVWNHYVALLSDLERIVGRAVRAEQKAAAASGALAAELRRRWGYASDPRVQQALAEGWPVFRTRARQRVPREHASSVFINRCPRCDRVARTPRARQCLWCGEDWHDHPAG